MLLKRKDRIYGGCVVAVLSIAITLFLFMQNDIAPLGKLSPFIMDFADQYIDFIQYTVHSSIWEKLYSFTKGMGGNMIGLHSYYTNSVLNIIFAFFPVEKSELAFLIVCVFRFGIMALSMYAYLCSHFDNCYKNIPFALTYAFFPYFWLNYFNILWFDGFALFPLLILGTEKIVRENKRTLFIAVFVYILWSNYYVAYMSALAVIIWFIYLHAIDRDFSFKKLWINLVNMAHNALLCVFVCAPFLMTSFIRMTGNKLNDTSIQTWTEVKKFGWKIFPVLFFEHTWMYESLTPLTSCIICLFLIAAFVASDKVMLREKLSILSVAVIFILCITLRPLSYVWTGFSAPVGFPFRQTFVYAFVFALLSRWGFELVDRKSAIFAIAIMAVVYMYCGYYYIRYRYLPWDKYSLKITLVAIALSTILLFIKEKFDKPVSAVVSVVIIVSTVFQASYLFHFTTTPEYKETITHFENGGFAKMYDENVKAINLMDEQGFYRTENIGKPQLVNWSFLYNQKTTTHFSSLFDNIQMEWFDHLGYDRAFYGTTYTHLNPVYDSLMGIKYIVAEKDEDIPYYIRTQTETKAVFENPYVFPIFYTGNSNKVEYSESPTEHINNMTRLLFDTLVFDNEGQIDYFALDTVSERINSQKAQIIEADGAKVHLSVPAGCKYLLTSVIYEDSWNVKVNGKKVTPEKYMDYFLSVPLDDDTENEIEMLYMPKGLVPGTAIAVITIIGEIGYIIIKKKFS